MRALALAMVATCLWRCCSARTHAHTAPHPSPALAHAHPRPLQQDITRGRMMVDSVFQGPGAGMGGTHNAVLSSSEYLSQAQRKFNNIEEGFYISPAFLDKITIHVAKNFMDLPKIKVGARTHWQLGAAGSPGCTHIQRLREPAGPPGPSVAWHCSCLRKDGCTCPAGPVRAQRSHAPRLLLTKPLPMCLPHMGHACPPPSLQVPLILGIWGGKGQGKTFQCGLAFKKLGISPIVMSAGELESGNAGEPAKLIRQRYREASDIIKKKGQVGAGRTRWASRSDTYRCPLALPRAQAWGSTLGSRGEPAGGRAHLAHPARRALPPRCALCSSTTWTPAPAAWATRRSTP